MRLIERLRIAFSGRKLTDAIKPDVDALVMRAGAICLECRGALDEAAALRAKTSGTSHLSESSAANGAALKAVLESFDNHEFRIHQLVAELHDAEHALVDRIDSLASLYKIQPPEKAQLIEKIAALRQPAMDMHARFLHDFMSLERLWQQWPAAGDRESQQDATRKRKRA